MSVFFTLKKCEVHILPLRSLRTFNNCLISFSIQTVALCGTNRSKYENISAFILTQEIKDEHNYFHFVNKVHYQVTKQVIYIFNVSCIWGYISISSCLIKYTYEFNFLEAILPTGWNFLQSFNIFISNLPASVNGTLIVKIMLKAHLHIDSQIHLVIQWQN